VVKGLYLEIFHIAVGESTGLLKANWEMSLPTSLKIICDQSISIIVDGDKRVSDVSRC